MKVVRSVAALRAALKPRRAAGDRIALVPTMGALHAAHAALMAAAHARSDHVVATIFVNPRQFGDHDDLARYPRSEDADFRQLRAGGVGLVFAPPVKEMYPDRFATSVVMAGPAEGLCGAVRPGHFSGVATVVTKLLLQCLPDLAVFGEKDYQQLVVVRQLARDLDIPVDIASVPTVREPDGLACSSRNAYLNPEERAAAAGLFRALRKAAHELSAGAGIAPTGAGARRDMLEAGFEKVDYVELRRADTLDPVTRREGTPARLLAAARLGRTRLIDNLGLRY